MRIQSLLASSTLSVSVPVPIDAAGLSVGYWADPSDLRANWQEDKRWSPNWDDDQRSEGYAGWRKAVGRTLG